MTISAQSIIRRVVGTLQDPTSIRWPISELARYFNDGQREILLHRPDAKSTTIAHTCVAGTRQTVSADYAKVLEVSRNTNGAAVRMVTREILDAQIPGWHTLSGSATIKHFMFDSREPRVFHVYPPATTSASLDVMVADYPTDISEPADGGTYSDISGNMDLPDIYSNVLHDYICYRCYAKDAEYAGNEQRAGAFYTAFANSLGIELKGTIALAPTTRGNPNHPGASAQGPAVAL